MIKKALLCSFFFTISREIKIFFLISFRMTFFIACPTWYQELAALIFLFSLSSLRILRGITKLSARWPPIRCENTTLLPIPTGVPLATRFCIKKCTNLHIFASMSVINWTRGDQGYKFVVLFIQR